MLFIPRRPPGGVFYEARTVKADAVARNSIMAEVKQLLEGHLQTVEGCMRTHQDQLLTAVGSLIEEVRSTRREAFGDGNGSLGRVTVLEQQVSEIQRECKTRALAAAAGRSNA